MKDTRASEFDEIRQRISFSPCFGCVLSSLVSLQRSDLLADSAVILSHPISSEMATATRRKRGNETGRVQLAAICTIGGPRTRPHHSRQHGPPRSNIFRAHAASQRMCDNWINAVGRPYQACVGSESGVKTEGRENMTKSHKVAKQNFTTDFSGGYLRRRGRAHLTSTRSKSGGRRLLTRTDTLSARA